MSKNSDETRGSFGQLETAVEHLPMARVSTAFVVLTSTRVTMTLDKINKLRAH